MLQNAQIQVRVKVIAVEALNLPLVIKHAARKIIVVSISTPVRLSIGEVQSRDCSILLVIIM